MIKFGTLSNCCINSVLTTTVVCICVILFTGIVQPYHRGFYCDDESISKPLKANTISVRLLLRTILLTPLILILIVEFLFVSDSNPSYRLKSSSTSTTSAITSPNTATTSALVSSSTSSLSSTSSYDYDKIKSTANADYDHHQSHTIENRTMRILRRRIQSAILIYLDYLYGFLINASLMHIFKSTFGGLRPNFLALCRPNFTLIDCSKHNGYVKDPFCTNVDPYLARLGRESFPSGHASMSIYSWIFITFYLCRSIQKASHHHHHYHHCRFIGGVQLKMLMYLVLTAYSVFTFVCSYSRITDYWHHWYDVFAGDLQGIFVGVILFRRKFL